jgi:hypothetical protein
MHSEVVRALDAALRLASSGQGCLPCFTDKRPATSYGFQHAESDRDKVHELRVRYPTPLVGVATGLIYVLDIGASQRADAAIWFSAVRQRLPATRIHCTQSVGNNPFEELVLGALREAHPELFDRGAA